MPLNKPDVQGVMMGTASFDWKASGSTILPGAICEHFTSFGGVMTQRRRPDAALRVPPLRSGRIERHRDRTLSPSPTSSPRR